MTDDKKQYGTYNSVVRFDVGNARIAWSDGWMAALIPLNQNLQHV